MKTPRLTEEIDALTLDQEGERESPDDVDGSGRISDDVARMRMEELTESGPDLDDIGGDFGNTRAGRYQRGTRQSCTELRNSQVGDRG